MATESLQPSQGLLNTSEAGLLGTSEAGIFPTVSNPSLLESKQQQVAAISDAKKQALDPSVVSAKDLFAIDADTIVNDTTNEKYRLTYPSPGTSYNPFEVFHPGKPLDQARINKNIDALVKDNPSLNASYFSNESVFARGRAAEAKLKQTITDAGNVSFAPTGEKDKWGRTLADIFAAGSDQSLLPAMNNPEFNADYHSKYNIVKEGQDLIQKAAEREKATEFSVSDANLETFLGGATNLATTAGVAFGDSVGRVLKAPAQIAQSLRETGITQKQRDLYASLNTKIADADKAGVDYTPTVEEQTILESPLQAFKRETLKPVMDGERNIAASDFLNLASVAQPSMSIFQKLSASDRVQQTYTDPLNVVHDTASKLINTSGTDELRRQTEGLANDAVLPSIAEGYAKFKGGKEVDGALQIADAVANYVVGTGRVAANNKQAAIEEIGRILPDMLMAGVSMPALFAGLGTETEAEAVKGYVKEHGVQPEGAALVRLRLDAWSSAALDSVADKYLSSSTGATKAIAGDGAAEALTAGMGGIKGVAAEALASSIGGRSAALAGKTPGFIKAAGSEDFTEVVQSLLEQDAAKQDVSKIDLGQALSAGSLGAIGGGGISVASQPIEAIKDVGSAIAATGSTALNLASKLVPTGVTEAFTSGTQAVTDAVGSTTQAVRDSIDEVNSSTTTPTVDPLQQSTQATDSVEALRTLLKPESIASATSTPEGSKAFVTEASRHNTELSKELLAITDPSTPPTEENTARAKVLLTEFRSNKEKIDGIKSKYAEADTTDADLAAATTPDWLKRPGEADVQSADTLQAVDRVIRSMRQPDKITLEQAESLQAKATLTPEQASVVTAFIATKKASVNMGEVAKDVMFGKPGFLGMVEHQAMLSDALDQDNIPAAQSALTGFKAFAASQTKKVDSLNAIVSAISDSNVEQVKDLVTKYAKDFPSSQTLKLGKYEILKILDKPSVLEKAKTPEALRGFQSLTNNVGKEANMLNFAYAEAELHFKLGSTQATSVPVKQESGLLTPVVNAPIVNAVPVPTTAQEAADKVLEDKALLLDRLAQEEDDQGELGFPEDAAAFRDRAAKIRARKGKPLNAPVPVVDPITNVVADPVTIDTAVDQVTTDTTGNAEEATVTDPVSEVVAASVETTSTNVTKSQPVSSLQAESDKRIDSTYAEYADIMADEVTYPDPYVGHLGVMTALQDRIDKELSSRIAALQISAESKQDLQERYDEIIERNEEPMEARKSIIEEIRANEKYIAEHQSELFESTTETGTTEVDLLEQIKELAAKKSYTKSPNLITAVNNILAANSIEQYVTKIKGVADFSIVDSIIKMLETKPNKPTSLGEYLLDSTRKFIGDKKLSDYYLAKVLDKVSKYSALITTPNFFSALKDPGVKEALGLTPEQLNGLDKLTVFVNKFADTFKADTFTDDRVKFSEGLSRNPALYFMKEAGRDFDENFVSTLATVAYSWVANNANSLIEHSDEGINSLLGRDSKHKISDDERELLSDKQILKSALITSLGKEIVSSLGLTFNPKADGSIESKMVEALGAYAVMTLEHMGYLNKSVAIHKKVYLALKNGKPVPEVRTAATGQNAIYFTGVATTVVDSDNKKYKITELSKDVQDIVDDNRLSKGLLPELFGYAQQRALPLLEAPEFKNMPNIIKRGIKSIPERMRKALHKYASNGFTINMDNHAVYSFLEPEQRLEMLGYNETLEGVHAVNIKSVQGTNRTSRNEVEAYDQLIEHLDQQEGKLSTPMYFLSSVWKSGRAGMEGLINPQASKFHRHMLGMGAWESTIDSPAKLKLFKIAVAEALGSKVDRQGDETSLEAFDRLIGQPEIRDGIASIKYLKSGVKFSAEDKLAAQEDILAAIKKGGSKTHTLEALTALATYSETEPFTTRMTKEVDGVTNGVIIGLIQLMGQRPKELLEFLKAGGLSEDKNFVYGEFISKVGNFDNYQRMAHSLVGYKDAFYKEIVDSKGVAAKDRTKTANAFIKAGGTQASLDGLDFFVGALMKDGNLTKEARDLAKNPLMITSYGAAMKNVIEGLGKDIIANFYSKLEKNKNNPEMLDDIARQLGNILGTKQAITTDDALTFRLNKADTAKFQELVATSIGVSMSDAIKEHFQTFIDKRKELNNAMNLVHAAFIIKYDAAYKKARDAKGSNLSREEVDALVKKLEPSMASFDHAMSDGEMDTELYVGSNESKTVTIPDPKNPGEFIPDPDYHVQVNSKKPLPHGIGSVTAHGSVSYFGFPGVSSVIKAIHSSDGAVQYKLMETSAVLNVHDADLAGIDGTMAMAQRQNLAFKEVMEDYSARASIQKTLLRAMKALTPEEVVKVNALLMTTDDTAEGFLGHDFVTSEYVGDEKFTYPKYESIDAFVNVFTGITKSDLAAKKDLLASLKSWGQYNLNHGAYVVEGESEDLLAAIAEMEVSLEQEEGVIDAMVAEEIAHMVKAERDAINRAIKSSATETIDVDTFVADFKPITVSAQTVESIFDQLGKLDPVTDTVAHTEHLRDILNTSIKQVLNPMEILVRKLGKANSGVLAKGKVYLSLGNTSRLHTTDQSAQEVYAHELVHAVTAAALSTDYWLHKRVRSLYEKVQKHITPESFLDYDGQGDANNGKGNIIVPAGSTLDQTIAKAKAVHDHIFDNNDITKIKYKNPITNEIEDRQYSNGLLEFVAMGTTNAKFIKILAGINTNRSKKAPMTFADHVYNAFVGAINSAISLINKTKDPAANVALMSLMHKLANANQVKSNFIMRKLEANGHLEEIVNSKLYKVLAYSALTSGQLLKARKNKTLATVGEIIGLSQGTSFEEYKKVAGKLARRIGITHKSFFAKLVTEAEGITAISAAYMHMLSKSNKFIDQLRRLEAQSLTNQILGSFIAGTPSKSEGIGITKVLLKTDMGSLIDNGYTWDKLFGLLKSRSKRLAEIAAVEQQLQAEAPTNFDYYKTQAASLGYMMVNGQPLKWGTKINAVNIAHLGGTGKTVEGNLDAIEKYLDILASLHAIKYSDKGHVTDFVTVAEREFAKDKDNNGVMLSYLAHKDLKARALEQSFEGQKGLMMKGYTKEIYNPRVSIITAPSSMEAELKAKGYIKEREDMSKDPLDLNKEPMSLYVNKDGDTATFNKFIVSLTSKRSKGTNLAAGYSSIGELNPALLGSFDAAHATVEGMKIVASKDYTDLSKITTNNLLVPVENNKHEVVGYRYLMNEVTKDNILQKDNSFAKVLGAMEGSIVDKRESKKINNEVVNLMRKDFLANYKKDPDLFIKFSPRSQDEKERELYHMLPDDMRREIKRVWKSDEMYVRASMFDAIFGYRKFTVTEGSKEQDEMNAMHDGVLTKFRISLRDKLRTPSAKRGEIALQEIAKEVKDAIVIKLGGTLYNNIISNNLLLWVKGVSRSSIVKDQAMFLDAARQYHKDLAELKELERSVRINPKLQNSANVKARVNSLKDHMAVNPIAFLMDSAVSQTIIEDVDTDESQYTYKGMIQEKLDPLVSRVPKPLRRLASIAYMTHDTALYKFMREGTQLSDLVARATLHKHNTEKKGMSLVDSINDIKDTFIDYDAPTSKQIQYLNDTNFLMFTKFFIRSQKIIYQTYANAPARALSLLGFEDVFGEMSTINDSNIINTSILGKLNIPVTLMDDLVVPHTLSLLDPTGAGGGSYTPQ